MTPVPVWCSSDMVALGLMVVVPCYKDQQNNSTQVRVNWSTFKEVKSAGCHLRLLDSRRVVVLLWYEEHRT